MCCNTVDQSRLVEQKIVILGLQGLKRCTKRRATENWTEIIVRGIRSGDGQWKVLLPVSAEGLAGVASMA